MLKDLAKIVIGFQVVSLGSFDEAIEIGAGLGAVYGIGEELFWCPKTQGRIAFSVWLLSMGS